MRAPATKVTIHLEGKAKVLANLRKVKGELLDAIALASNQAGLEIETQAKRWCPEGISTSLKQHIKNKFRREGDRLMISDVEAKKNYAAFVEFGTSRMGAKTFYAAASAKGYRGVVPSEYQWGQRHKFPGRRGVPFRSIVRWAELKGVDAFGLAAAIAGWKPGRPPGIKAQPYLGPAFASVSVRFVASIKNALRRFA